MSPEGKIALERVRDYILAHPEELDMAHWVCGTTACVAGRLCLMEGWSHEGYAQVKSPEGVWGFVSNVAANILGLSLTTADSLFQVSYWPTEFHAEYINAYDHEEKLQLRAKITARRIDHFIATGE